ncbi:MAG: PDZ domain-containing protein [Acidobacteria bacterium]|nr:PDZ domain-containing protein [Acidobacteriota bacterium]
MLKRLVQLTVILTVVAIATAVGISNREKKQADAYDAFGVFARVYNIVKARYVEPVDEARIMEGAYRGAVESVFDQNSYIPADIMARIRPRLAEKGRVGIRVIKRGGYAQVVHVEPGSEIEKAGIVAGTIIQKINGKYTWDLSLFSINAMLMGQVGKPVNLTYYSMDKGKDEDHIFQYQELNPDATSVCPVEKLSAFRIESFSIDVANRFDKYAATAKPIILDLRYTQGRNYRDMLTLAAFILDKEVTATAKRKGAIKTISAKPGENAPTFAYPRIFVLTSGFTMNAGAVLANLLKGGSGITLVGTRTSGKAFDTEVLQLYDGAYVELATVFYSPTTKKGLKPDVRSYIDDSEIADKINNLLKKEASKANGDKTAA